MGNQPDAVRDLVNTADIPYARRVFTQYAGFDPDVVWHTFLHTEAVFACALPNQEGRAYVQCEKSVQAIRMVVVGMGQHTRVDAAQVYAQAF